MPTEAPDNGWYVYDGVLPDIPYPVYRVLGGKLSIGHRSSGSKLYYNYDMESGLISTYNVPDGASGVQNALVEALGAASLTAGTATVVPQVVKSDIIGRGVPVV